MAYKLIIMAPSCGGKSTLMRYFRENTSYHIAETDEEVMNANGGIWPDNELKNNVLVPQTTKEILTRKNVIYFASYIPTALLLEAKNKNFSVVVLDIPKEELIQRNVHRMNEENYDDVSPWFAAQLSDYEQLKKIGVVDNAIDGNQDVKIVADEIERFIKQKT